MFTVVKHQQKALASDRVNERLDQTLVDPLDDAQSASHGACDQVAIGDRREVHEPDTIQVVASDLIGCLDS